METKIQLKVKKYKDTGDIAWEYNPLRNLKKSDDQIDDFTVSNSQLKLDLENPIDIECQSSYDGSTNLIFNDDKNPPRIINTRMALLENNRYKIINRNQIKQSNLYTENELDQQTRLFRNVTRIPKIQFKNVDYFGTLKGGNYIFYIKYSDSDYNETDIVAESGIISVFKGDLSNPKTCTGAYMDERTDKSIILYLKNIDTSFSYVNIYYSRTSCDVNGISKTDFHKIKKTYEITDVNQTITINGFEELEDITAEDLNIQYNYVESVKSQAQVQNRLFFANVSKLKEDSTTLSNLALYIYVEECQEHDIGFITDKYGISSEDITKAEYYSPYNIYYRLGYFPGEIYRFGVVFIYNDEHLSPVYNLRGIDFNLLGNKKCNYDRENINPNDPEVIDNKDFISLDTLENTRGVFRFTKDKSVINYDEKKVKPLGLKISIPEFVITKLKELNIKGYYFVRQERIPTFLFSGLSVGVDTISGIPCLWVGEKEDTKLVAESFVNKNKVLINDYTSKLIYSNNCNYSGLLSADVKCDKQIQSLLNSDRYKLVEAYKFEKYNQSGRSYTLYSSENVETTNAETTSELLYINSDVPQMIINDNIFCTRAAMQEEVKQQTCFGKEDMESSNVPLVRGIFTDFVGCNSLLGKWSIYNVYIKNYSEAFNKEYFQIRIDDNSPYFAVSDRYATDNSEVKDKDIGSDTTKYKDEKNGPITLNWSVIPILYRGDCFTYTTTIRLHRNFTSQTVPTNDTIVDFNTWKDNFKGIRNTENWDDINIGDINAVAIGSWVTFKGLSNNNISLRSIDSFNTEEIALMGNTRGFYPVQGMSTKASYKIPESNLYNRGYSTTLGFKRNYKYIDVPYEVDEFDTRIMFSDIQVDGNFKNSYKVFQGLSYEDLDRQYGGIVKILPWGENLLTVFEHAIAIVPVNEKALIQTTTGQNIHMYGSGVLQKQMTIITDMYGSIWKDSIIRTPRAVYGVDTYAKKIWRLTDKGLELISDFTIQRFLNDEINLKELEKTVVLGIRNVKTHFNAYKNDVMFTFYNDDKIWNICYNEVRNMWVTRYSWTPLLSENINNTYFSFDLLKSKIFSIISNNLRKTDDLVKVNTTDWTGMYKAPTVIKDKDTESSNIEYNTVFKFDVDGYTGYNINNIIIKGYYWDKDEIKAKELIVCKANEENWFIENVEENWISITNRNIENPTEFKTEKERQEKIYDNYIAIKDSAPFSITFKDIPKNKVSKEPEGYLYYTIDIDYLPYIITSSETTTEPENDRIVFGVERSYTAGMIIPYESLDELEMDKYKEDWNKALLYSIFVHGRSNIIDEIDYFDKDEENQILPTKWYNKQEPFEFEFVVNEPKGIHKIFDNLVIISNNVEPNSIEIEITGDVYEFSKRAIYRNNTFPNTNESENVEFSKIYLNKADDSETYKTDVVWDPIRNEYYLNVHANCLNIKKYGRRLGNIYYSEDAWYFQVQPIYYKQKSADNPNSPLRTTKVRDKYAKVRIKYKGDKLVIITALQTLMTQSYA